MERVPDGILRRDVDGVHGSADAEMCAGVDAERTAADDAVEVEFETRGTGGVDGRAGLGRGRVGVDHVLVEIADQAAGVVVECGGRERAVDDEGRVDGEHGGLVVGEWAGSDATATGAVRNLEARAKDDGAGVVGCAVAGHAVLGAVEDGGGVDVGSV